MSTSFLNWSSNVIYLRYPGKEIWKYQRQKFAKYIIRTDLWLNRCQTCYSVFTRSIKTKSNVLLRIDVLSWAADQSIEISHHSDKIRRMRHHIWMICMPEMTKMVSSWSIFDRREQARSRFVSGGRNNNDAETFTAQNGSRPGTFTIKTCSEMNENALGDWYRTRTCESPCYELRVDFVAALQSLRCNRTWRTPPLSAPPPFSSRRFQIRYIYPIQKLLILQAPWLDHSKSFSVMSPGREGRNICQASYT
jgi:hypothetical protein